MKQNRACDTLTVFETANALHTVAAGWYYGGVPTETQTLIDQSIINLSLQSKIQEILKREIDSSTPLSCAALPMDIPPGVLGWLFLYVLLACIAFIVVFAAFISQMKGRDDIGPNDQDENPRFI